MAAIVQNKSWIALELKAVLEDVCTCIYL